MPESLVDFDLRPVTRSPSARAPCLPPVFCKVEPLNGSITGSLRPRICVAGLQGLLSLGNAAKRSIGVRIVVRHGRNPFPTKELGSDGLPKLRGRIDAAAGFKIGLLDTRYPPGNGPINFLHKF